MKTQARIARPEYILRDDYFADPEERLAVTPGFRLGCERDEEARMFILAQNYFAISFRLIPGWDQRTGRRIISGSG